MIPHTAHHFKTHLRENKFVQEENNLSDEEFKKAFFSLKINKSPGYDDINFNVIKQIYQNTKTLKHN